MINYIESIQGLLIGLVSGVLSGLFVYYLTKNREEKYQTYYFWLDFLLGALAKNDLYFPSEQLRMISKINKDKNSVWNRTIREIISLNDPFEVQDRIYTQQEEKLAKDVLTALDELSKWKKKNHIK